MGDFTCDESENGEEAKLYCARMMPDIIILDWNMPVINGLDFIKSLRAMKNGHHPKVVFCTTENSMQFIQVGMDAGADEYIMKPFNRQIIESKFEQLGLIEGTV
jgi:two-component system chemotaxis response regulator CheY